VTALDSLLSRQPWLITAEAMQAMATQAAFFLDNSDRLPDRASNPLLSVEDEVGVIRVHGPLMRNPDLFSVLLFGATDMDTVAAAIAEAARRDDVRSILLDIDSPGGTVNGTPELAQAVADAAKAKTLYAFSAGQMASAAYWIASQADAIYATPSARIGSIGVLLPMIDSTERFRAEGLRVEVFAAGKFKTIGTPGVPLTDEQRSLLQGDIEEIAADFRAAVLARGRKIPDEAMEGQSFSARQAQRHNLAGMVKSRAEVIARLRSLRAPRVDTSSGASTPMKTIEDQLQEALARVHTLEADAKARDSLLSEASGQVGTLKQTLAHTEQALQSLTAERDALKARAAGRKAGDKEDDEPYGDSDDKDEEEAKLLRRLVRHLLKDDEDDEPSGSDDEEEGKAKKAKARAAKLFARVQALEQLAERNTALETQLRDLQARDQDLDKRAAVKAAQIAAEMGSQVPARVTPAADTKPASAAEVWSRQFTKA
jgi:signal peptide peptidase SppA